MSQFARNCSLYGTLSRKGWYGLMRGQKVIVLSRKKTLKNAAGMRPHAACTELLHTGVYVIPIFQKLVLKNDTNLNGHFCNSSVNKLSLLSGNFEKLNPTFKTGSCLNLKIMPALQKKRLKLLLECTYFI